MRIIIFLLIAISCTSCFLFPEFRKEQLSFSRDNGSASFTIAVPKGYSKKEKRTGATGNEEYFYHYPDGGMLYFVRVQDSTYPYQPINYEVNQPKTLFDAQFFKGIDSSHGFYWRENRIGNYKAGYYRAAAGEEWLFDSSLNSFTLRLPR